MKKKPGRPKKASSGRKSRYLQVRVDAAEKATFDAAAEYVGLDLSQWVRTNLRDIARKQLSEAGIPFPLAVARTKDAE